MSQLAQKAWRHNRVYMLSAKHTYRLPLLVRRNTLNSVTIVGGLYPLFIYRQWWSVPEFIER